jgi:nucleotide-binding universal stress UspA family protein
VRHTTAVETGTPLEVISAAARQADLVVLGSRGLGAVSGVVLGSLSHRLLGTTTVPVLVVP